MAMRVSEAELSAAHRRACAPFASPRRLVDAAPEHLRAGPVRLMLNVEEVAEDDHRLTPL